MPVNTTTESEAMKLSLNYGEGPDGKIVTRSKTFSELAIDVAPEAVMNVSNAMGTLMAPTIDATRLITTKLLTESV